jgi:Putative transposase
MPDVLWPFFRDNPALTKALPVLATEAIRAQVATRYGLRVGVMAILHTFNGKLDFNSHVHTMVTAGGLHESSEVWVASILYDSDSLMRSWQRAVIAILRAAARAGQLVTKTPVDRLEELLDQQETRWWRIKIQSFEDKGHFLKYAGRYIRRPPIAQHRITLITDRTVAFWYKDKKLRRKVEVRCSPEEFVERWAQHIPERYTHAVRSFGLFAPREQHLTTHAIFAMFGQNRRPRPKPLSWAWLIKHTFGRDPLQDRVGNSMRFVRRFVAEASSIIPT